MKNYFKKIVKNIILQIVSILLIVVGGFVVYAISWPSSVPTGEVAGGSFSEKFQKIFSAIIFNGQNITVTGKVKMNGKILDSDSGNTLVTKDYLDNKVGDVSKKIIQNIEVVSGIAQYGTVRGLNNEVYDSTEYYVRKEELRKERNNLVKQTQDIFANLKSSDTWDKCYWENGESRPVPVSDTHTSDICGGWIAHNVLNTEDLGVINFSHCGDGSKTCTAGSFSIRMMYLPKN